MSFIFKGDWNKRDTYFRVLYGLVDRSVSNQHSLPSLLPTITLSPTHKKCEVITICIRPILILTYQQVQSVRSDSLEDFKILKKNNQADLWPTTRMDWDGGNLTETWLQLLYQLCLLEIINPNKLLSSNKEHLLTWMECCRNRKAWQFTERMVRVLFCELMQQYSSCITYKGIKVYKGNKITVS